MYARQFYHVSRPQLHSHVDWPLLADCVEKVAPLKLPGY